MTARTAAPRLPGPLACTRSCLVWLIAALLALHVAPVPRASHAGTAPASSASAPSDAGARTAAEWLPLVEAEARDADRTADPATDRLACGVFFYRSIKRMESSSLKLYPQEQAAVDAYKDWYSKDGQALAEQWASGKLAPRNRGLEMVIAWAHFMREWEKEGFKAEGPATACPREYAQLAMAMGVGPFFMNEPWRTRILDGYRALVRGYAGGRLSRTELESLAWLWNILILKSGDGGIYLPHHVGLDKPFSPAGFDPIEHDWPPKSGAYPADLIARPFPDVMLPRLDAILQRPNFANVAGRRDDPRPLLRPGAAGSLPFLRLMKGYTVETDRQTGRCRVVPLLAEPQSVPVGQMLRLGEFKGRKIVFLATGNIGDPYVRTYLPALQVLRNAYGQRVEFFAVAIPGSAGYKGYRFPFQQTFFGERPVKLAADVEDVARYCKRWMMDACYLEVPVLLENEYYHFSYYVHNKGGNDDFTLLDQDGAVAYIKGSRRTMTLTPSVLLLNIIETEIQALLANDGKRPADHTGEYINPWELYTRNFTPGPGGKLVRRQSATPATGTSGQAVEYPFADDTIAIYAHAGVPWFVGRVVAVDAAAGTVTVENAQSEAQRLPWLRAWDEQGVLKDLKPASVIEVERRLARGKKPVVFKAGPKTTVWLNGMAARLADYRPGDAIGILYSYLPTPPDLDLPVPAVHIRVGRIPAASAKPPAQAAPQP